MAPKKSLGESTSDLSEGDESDYSKLMSIRNERGVKLLFCKSKVYIHPTSSAKDNICGYLALIQQKSSSSTSTNTTNTTISVKGQSKHSDAVGISLAWIPEASLGPATHEIYAKVENKSPSSEDVETANTPTHPPSIPAIPFTSSPVTASSFAVPILDIYSIVIRPPNKGWWHGSLIINTRRPLNNNSTSSTSDTEGYPALFFHNDDQSPRKTSSSTSPHSALSSDSPGDWGGPTLLSWLRAYTSLHRATSEPNTYLLNPAPDDALNFSVNNTSPSVDKVARMLESPSHSSSSNHARSASSSGLDLDFDLEPVTKALKEVRWSFLEKLSQVTTFTRRTAQAVVEHKNVPPQVRRLMMNEDVKGLQEEFDSARLYLARWAGGIAEDSGRRGSINDKGTDKWKVKKNITGEEGDMAWQIIDSEHESNNVMCQKNRITMNEWKGWWDKDGRLQLTVDEVKEKIFHCQLDGIEVRREAWLFLLGVYDWESSAEERAVKINSLRDEYVRLKGKWWDRLVDGEGTLEEREWWRDQKHRIEKDVHRTDRHIPLFEGEDMAHPDPSSPFAEIGTNVHLEQMKDMLLTYNEYDRSLGYVQGMSDLLSPLYAVLQDDAVSFWAFVHFMKRMERNFLRNQTGMRSQLVALDQLVKFMDPELYAHLARCESTNFFFFFRPLLVWYKREFSFDDIMLLWEAFWTDYLTSQFHLFVALAILERHRSVIMGMLRGFDEVLKYVNELSETMDLKQTLIRAEALFCRFRKAVEAVDKKDNFPNVPGRVRKGKAPAIDSGPARVDTRISADANSKTPRTGSTTNVNSASTSTGNTSSDDNEVKITPELRNLLSRTIVRTETHD